ncbi:MAG TPA: hypothetical protein DEB06_09635 [Phycisphaerales bacterium]|nr:hypothetical protein [Phycisphaerales bacterium]
MIRWSRPALVALAVSLSLAARAPAQPGAPLPTPEEVLEECLMKFEMILADADDQISDERDDAIEEIEYLDGNGAPDKRITREARNGRKRVQGEARTALAELNRTHGDCFINLRRRGADREMNEELDDQMRRSVRELRRLANAAYADIDAARDAALADDDGAEP